MALVSDTASWRELKEKAENLKDMFESVPGVRTAETWAFPNPEVRVAIDLQRLARAGVSLDQVIQTIQGQNQNVPGGSVDVGLRRYNLRTSGSYTSLDQIADTVVGRRRRPGGEGPRHRRRFLADGGADLHRTIQRQARRIHHGESKGQHQHFQGARRHLRQAGGIRKDAAGGHQARARLRSIARTSPIASASWARTSRSRSHWCC